MKKIYMIPCLRISDVDLSSLCQVIGNVSGSSGTGEGEEELGKDRQPKNGDESWGNLW